MATSKEDRLFNPSGRKHYRRRYDLTEVRIGFAILVLLGVIAGWVLYKGQFPDPEIYASSPGQMNRAPTKAADRGPIPKGLASEGFREGELSVFDDTNLYEKIDGREGYYKSFGFVRLHFIALAADADPAQTVDIEMYDLGDPKNALGAFAGEIPPDATPTVGDGGLAVVDRNALFLTRGKFYVRGIGADESEPVKAQLEHVANVLRQELDGAPLPWSYALFVRGLGLNPGKVSYQPTNAFAFGFAKDVHVGLLPDEETEVFVVAQPDAEAATALAAKYKTGFEQYGELRRSADGVPWIADRYLDRISGAKSSGEFVIGIRSAADVDAAIAAMAKLDEALAALPDDVRARARTAEAPAEPPPAAEEGYGEGAE